MGTFHLESSTRQPELYGMSKSGNRDSTRAQRSIECSFKRVGNNIRMEEIYHDFFSLSSILELL